MKRLLLALLGFGAAVSAQALETSDVNYSQTSGSQGLSLIWEFDFATYNAQKCAVITGVKNGGGTATVYGDLAIPETVIYDNIGYIVKAIAADAFRNQVGISSLAFPKTVQDVETPFCSGCSLLASITVDEANPWYTSFNGMLFDKDKETLIACPETMETAQLPSTLTTVGDHAFEGCFRVKSINLPANVETIGDRAFAGCPKLKSITFNGDAPTADGDVFADTALTVYVPEGNTSFGAVPGSWQGQALQYSTGGIVSGVTSAVAGNVSWSFRVVNGQAELYNNGQSCIGAGEAQTSTWDGESFAWIPDGELRIPSTLGGYPVTRIGENAFLNCSALVKVSIPESVMTIGNYAFRNCSGIKSLTFPENVKSIGYHAFEGSSLTALELPDSLRALDGNPMAGCDTMLNVTINGDNSFFAVINGLLYDKDVRTLIGCPARKEGASIASTCTAIGPEAFYGCFRTSALIIPDQVRAVGEYAFNLMPRLQSVVFPASIASLDGAGLFVGCTSLGFVGFSGDAPAVDDDLFLGTSEVLMVYVGQNTRGWNGDSGSSALPADGKWPVGGDNRRTIENLDVSAEADLKEGDVFTIINTNGTMYAWTMKVLANKGLEVIGINPKPIGSFTVPSEFDSVLGTMTVKSIGDRLFANSTGLISVTIPNTVTNLGDEAFLNCDVLASVTLANGLRGIGRHPFSGTAIETITLPDTVNAIDGNLLAGCAPSAGIRVGDANPYFAVTDQGVLYDKDFTALLAVPMTVEEIEIPASVTAFAEECFLGCIRLKKVAFLGDAPTAADGDDLYLDVHASMTNFVTVGNTTFGAVPGVWHLRPVVGSGTAAPIHADPTGRQEYTDEDGNIWLYTVENGEAQLGHWGSTPVLKDPDVSGVITVPEKLDGYPLSEIPDKAFDGCENISAIKIPATITAIGEGAFNGCTALEEIEVSPASTAFMSKYGVLYTRDGRTLIKVPAKFDFDWTLATTATATEKTVRIISQYFVETDGKFVLMPPVTNELAVGEQTTESSTSVHTARIPQESLFSGVWNVADYAFTDCGAVSIPESKLAYKVISAVATVVGDNTAVEQTVIENRLDHRLYEPLRIPASVDIGAAAIAGSHFTEIGDQSTARFLTAAPARLSSGTPLAASASAPVTSARKNYCGWIMNGGVPSGTVTLKSDAKNRVSGSVLPLGGKKKTVRSVEAAKSYGDLFIGEFHEGLKGQVWSVAFSTADDGGDPLLDGLTTLSLTVKAKGKVAVTGYAADGTKISASAQLVNLGDGIYIPVTAQLYTGKRGGFCAIFKIVGGRLDLVGASRYLGKTTSAEIAMVASGRPVEPSVGEPVYVLPYAYSPSAAAWKPRYNKKTGLITATCKVLDPAGRKKSVKIYGVSVEGKGYATAVIPKILSMPTTFAE